MTLPHPWVFSCLSWFQYTVLALPQVPQDMSCNFGTSDVGCGDPLNIAVGHEAFPHSDPLILVATYSLHETVL